PMAVTALLVGSSATQASEPSSPSSVWTVAPRRNFCTAAKTVPAVDMAALMIVLRDERSGRRGVIERGRAGGARLWMRVNGGKECCPYAGRIAPIYLPTLA